MTFSGSHGEELMEFRLFGLPGGALILPPTVPEDKAEGPNDEDGQGASSKGCRGSGTRPLLLTGRCFVVHFRWTVSCGTRLDVLPLNFLKN